MFFESESRTGNLCHFSAEIYLRRRVRVSLHVESNIECSKYKSNLANQGYADSNFRAK
jgi:hypothetical protein